MQIYTDTTSLSHTYWIHISYIISSTGYVARLYQLAGSFLFMVISSAATANAGRMQSNAFIKFIKFGLAFCQNLHMVNLTDRP